MGQKPDWEGFGRWATESLFDYSDIDGFDLFEAAKEYRLIKEVPGGFDPESHCPNDGEIEPGDPWFEYNFPYKRE